MFSKEEAKEMRHAFWTKLDNKSGKMPGRNGKPIRWIGDKTGIKGLELKFDVDREQAVVAMEIRHTAIDNFEGLWSKMENCKPMFSKIFGGDKLIWQKEYQKEAGDMVGRIYVSTPGDLFDKEKWSDMTRFMIDNMIQLETAFKEVQDYLKHF